MVLFGHVSLLCCFLCASLANWNGLSLALALSLTPRDSGSLITTNIKASSSHLSTRRAWFQQQYQRVAVTALVTGTSVSVLNSSERAVAATGTPTPAEIEKLRQGHARVRYLLEHWNEETQVCGKIIMSDSERKQVVRTEGAGSAGCEKTPLNVQNFMGYKSTEDPLYRADKLMVRAASLVDPDDFENYLEAVEKYKDKADNSAMMAYTSSWGEANPNGGKEVIDEYLERTKLDVEESERYLRQILGYLKLEPLPPSKNPK